MKIKTIIIEDNPKIRESLEIILKLNFGDINVIGQADNVAEGEAIIRKLKPDFVIFDIDIINGTSFDILTNLKAEGKVNFKFIFLTAHSNTENTIKAIKYSANDFLVKPIDAAMLKESISIIIESIKQKQDQNEKLELLLELLDNPNNINQRIGVQSSKGQIQNVVLNEVLYLKSDGILTIFKFIDGSEIKGYKNIGYYADNLCRDYEFIQIQQGIVVNLNYLKSFTPATKKVYLKNGIELEASRSGTKVLKEYLLDYSPSKLKMGFIKDLIQKLKI
ncbi:response regulator [Lacihabitans sp. LS3-19]|uniref:LytR/AlgR family response regulator transcription factor n=1 Tax=Lacihabitans sp. LS3-19 TaxID=2487335 RepID=UPI0020CBD34A|nr:response regulator transcription factor [Lacihabitans sp. LS3-19]MCP9770317.1 response regulator [Lacihabitans sp. LS3-19]